MMVSINFIFLCLLVIAVVGSNDNTRKSSWNAQVMKGSSNSTKQFTDTLPFTGHVFPIGKGRTMLRLIDQFSQFIYPPGLEERKKHQQILLNNHQLDTSPSSNKQQKTPLKVQWVPQSCSTIGLDLKVFKVLHKGSRNSVSLVYDRKKKKSKKYVWKVFDVAEEYTSELAFLMIARHPNIVKPICIFEEASTLPGIVMEYVDGSTSTAYFQQIFEDHTTPADFEQSSLGNLKERSRSDFKNQQVAMFNLQRVSAQLFAALSYMHSLGFVHADLKPENVLIDSQGNVVVIDFGFAIRKPYFKDHRGTDCTRAPELVGVIPKASIYENIDWWAFGSTVAQWHAVGRGVQMVRSQNSRSGGGNTKRKKQKHRNTKTWAPIRLGLRRGFIFGPTSQYLVDLLHPSVRQLLFHCMSLDPRLRMFNTSEQLQWLRNLPILQSADWSEIDIRHLTAS